MTPAEEQAPHEDFSDLIQWILDHRGGSMSDIARRIGVKPATVSAWRSRKRGGVRGPERETLSRIAEEYGLDPHRVFAAVGRKKPGHLPPEREQRILETLRDLTEAEQELIEIQARAWAERNRSGA